MNYKQQICSFNKNIRENVFVFCLSIQFKKILTICIFFRDDRSTSLCLPGYLIRIDCVLNRGVCRDLSGLEQGDQ